MEYFRIKNWDKYQEKKTKEGSEFHYVKLHIKMLDDPQVMRMSAHEFACWVKLLMYARRFDNKIPQDPRWIRARIGFPASHRRVDLAYLWDLGLLEAFSDKKKEREERKKETTSEREPLGGSLTEAERHRQAINKICGITEKIGLIQ